MVENKIFWLGLAMVMVLPLMSWFFLDISSLDSSSERTIQKIAFVKEGGFIQIDGKEVKGLEMVELSFKENIKEATIILEEDNSIPFEGQAYSKFKMYFTDKELAGKVSEAEFTLSLKKGELSGELTEENVRLYYGGKELATSKLSIVKDSRLYYQATSQGIGEFVIGKAKPKEEKKEEVKEEISPPKIEEVQAPEVEEILPVIEQPAPAEKSIFSKMMEFLKGLFN